MFRNWVPKGHTRRNHSENKTGNDIFFTIVFEHDKKQKTYELFVLIAWVSHEEEDPLKHILK